MLTLLFNNPIVEGDLSDHHDDEEDNQSAHNDAEANEHVDPSHIGQNIIEVVKALSPVI